MTFKFLDKYVKSSGLKIFGVNMVKTDGLNLSILPYYFSLEFVYHLTAELIVQALLVFRFL